MSPSESAGDDSTALAGRTIAVPETRQLDVLASLLERRGATVLRCPLVGIRDAPEQQPVIAWLRRRLATPSDDLIVFYTGEGVERLMSSARRVGIEATSSPRCVARARSRAARSRGVRCAGSISKPSSRPRSRRPTA
jgi:uroporphyrinogen-III synthase